MPGAPAIVGALVMAGAWLCAAAVPALAHTSLASSVPADGEAVPDPPVEVVLTFDEALAAGSDVAAEVIDPAGDDLVAAPPTVDGAEVRIPLNLAVNPGPHEVRFAYRAADGDRQTGTITFVLDPPPSVLTPLPATPPSSPTTPTTAATASTPEAEASPPVTPSPSPTPAVVGTTPSLPSPTPLPHDTLSPAASVGDGISPVLGTVLGVVALAAVAAVVLVRFRRPDQDV